MRTDLPRHGSRFLLGLVALLLAGCGREALEIRVEAPPDAQVVIAIRDSHGQIVRTITGEAAKHRVKWDARDEGGQSVAPGAYTAAIVTHRSFGTRVSGVVGGLELAASGGLGAPAAVVADEKRVYLAWSGGCIAAADLDGKILWSVALPQLAGCAALAIDGGNLFALARSQPPRIAEDALVRLRAVDGQLLPWPRGERLPIPALWPANAIDQPTHAGALAARAGHLYLAFPELHFLSVLSGETGEYLQTIIGPAPTAIDVVATRTASPTEPGAIIDADFAVIALGGGALGKVLFAHDPLWVIGSDAQRLDQDEHISALALLGDEAPHHPRSIFLGLGAPLHQVQRREILDPQGYVWLAGAGGGRAGVGPWQAEALGPVKAVALDALGRLWVAEGDAVPPRFSVWSTEGTQGHLVREFFGPLDPADSRAALLPGDPEIIVGAGCEWRLRADGPAQCLGVITHDGMATAAFSTDAKGSVRLHVRRHDGTTATFERLGEGDYAPRADVPEEIPVASRGSEVAVEPAGTHGWSIATGDGLPLGTALLPPELADGNAPLAATTRGRDGRVYGAVIAGGIVRVEIIGLEAIQSAPAQLLRVSAPAR